MGDQASSTTVEIYMQASKRTAVTTALHPPKVWEQFVDNVYSILKHSYLENFFHHINSLHQNIKLSMEEEYNVEISVSVYRKPTHTGQYLHYNSYRQTKLQGKCCFLLP